MMNTNINSNLNPLTKFGNSTAAEALILKIYMEHPPLITKTVSITMRQS